MDHGLEKKKIKGHYFRGHTQTIILYAYLKSYLNISVNTFSVVQEMSAKSTLKYDSDSHWLVHDVQLVSLELSYNIMQ